MADYVSDLKVGKKIGNGHFGEVFHGVDPTHGNVAVKVLRREAHHDDAAWQLYKGGALNEAQHLSTATHRNVVKVHHVVEGDSGNSVVICMEYCSGGSLQNKFEAGPMTLRAVKKAATEMLLGLGALHARKMLHRDIKPANILLDGQGVAKIADFGLVTDDLILGYGSQAGYSDHIAYEVWHNGPTSWKSDIWARHVCVPHPSRPSVVHRSAGPARDHPTRRLRRNAQVVTPHSEELAHIHSLHSPRRSG